DAQRRGVEVRPVDVNRSGVKCGLEDDAVRIGLEYVQSLREAGAEAIVEERRQLLWELGLAFRPATVPGSGGEERQLTLSLDPTAQTPELPDQTPWEHMLADYRL